MDNQTLMAVAIVVAAVVVLGAVWLFLRQRRTKALRDVDLSLYDVKGHKPAGAPMVP